VGGISLKVVKNQREDHLGSKTGDIPFLNQSGPT